MATGKEQDDNQTLKRKLEVSEKQVATLRDAVVGGTDTFSEADMVCSGIASRFNSTAHITRPVVSNIVNLGAMNEYKHIPKSSLDRS